VDRVTVPRLHVLTDVVLQRRWGHAALARAAFAGGADLVQVRQKAGSDAEVAVALREVAALPGRGVVVVDDRVGLAGLVDGVHVGPDDVDPWTARAACPGALIGATVGSLDRLAALAGAPIDYIGVGAVFGTASKGRPVGVIGLDGLAAICAASPWPVIAIGGVRPGSVREVLAAGAWGVAVLGGVVLADDPAAATAAYAEAVFG
jgi:thiamine-phosphate pyrophosphorylase